MTIVNENKDKNIKWENIEYGDTFVYADSNIKEPKDTDKWIGMKVRSVDGDDMIVDFETFEVYDDIEAYTFLNFVKSSLNIGVDSDAD